MIGSYSVYSGERTIQCSLSARLRAGDYNPSRRPARQAVHTDPVAVGDVVRFTDSQDGSGQIVEVLPRRNRLARRSAVPMPGAHAFEQVIVANVDQVVPVFAVANPAPHWNMLDRYLVSAESFELPSLICITKLDLACMSSEAGSSMARDLDEAIQQYRQAGYPVILTSAVTGEGVEELKEALKGRLSVLVGKSGVGKTFLLNTLQPGLGLRVNAVNQVTGKGRHTTTSQEMVRLEVGGAVVDTPGEREFGLWDVQEEELALLFPEMRPLVGRCRFGLDCRHDEEPGCAIRKAVMSGRISPRRYQSYMRLREELGAP